MTWLLMQIRRVPDFISAALLATITVLIAAQVLVRYVLGGSLVWSEELTRLLFVWMVLIAAATTPPMRVDMFVELLPARGKAIVNLVGELIVIALTLLLIHGAWGMMDLTQFDTYMALGISLWWLYLSLFVAAWLWLVRSLSTLATHWRALVSGPA